MDRYETVCLIATIFNFACYVVAGALLGLPWWQWLLGLPIMAFAALNGAHVIAYVTVGAKESKGLHPRFGKKE